MHEAEGTLVRDKYPERTCRESSYGVRPEKLDPGLIRGSVLSTEMYWLVGALGMWLQGVNATLKCGQRRSGKIRWPLWGFSFTAGAKK